MKRSRRTRIDIDAEKARIVRAMYDAIDPNSPGQTAEPRATFEQLHQDAQALGDTEFQASMKDALAHLEDGSKRKPS